MPYNVPVNNNLKNACSSIVNTYSVLYNITYDGYLEGDGFVLKIFDIYNNLYTITWKEYNIISNQSGVFINTELSKDLVPVFLHDVLLKILE